MNSSIKDMVAIQSFKKELSNDKSVIEVTDFGAGSRVFRDGKRMVSKIAVTAGISNKRGALLYKTIHYFKPKNILEIGTSLGIATTYMSYAKPDSSIYTLEGCPSIAKIASHNFKKFKRSNIDILVGEFSETLPQVLKNRKFDLIYFDGNHQEEPTIAYFKECLLNKNDDSVFIFDDIHLTSSMESAWKYIKNHKEVTISIDSYKWGMVFFRKGQEKEHFILRL